MAATFKLARGKTSSAQKNNVTGRYPDSGQVVLAVDGGGGDSPPFKSCPMPRINGHVISISGLLLRSRDVRRMPASTAPDYFKMRPYYAHWAIVGKRTYAFLFLFLVRMAAGYRFQHRTSCGYFATRRLYIVEFALVKSLGNVLSAIKRDFKWIR